MTRVSSSDVARRAGVSRATVSYVVNDRPDKTISAGTRRRVLDAVRELGYVPSATAAALSAGRSRIVVLLEDIHVPAEGEAVIALGSVSGVLRNALAREVHAWGMTLVAAGSDTSLTGLLRHLEPALVISLAPLTGQDTEALDRAGCRHVSAGHRDDVGAVHPAAFVASGASRLQVDHLVAHGHRRLAYLSTDIPAVAGLERARRQAAHAACAELDLPPLAEHRIGPLGSHCLTELEPLLRAWVDDGVTAVACFNDLHAVLVLVAARHLGLAVPGDLAVIGIDDDPVASLADPPLTTVAFDMVAFARYLAARGRAALDGEVAPPLPDATTLAHVVERAST